MSELDQFCVVASSQKGLSLVSLISQVLQNRKIFVFGELIALQSVQSVFLTFNIIDSTMFKKIKK